ncbi:MAG: CapA family protein [Clostridia bacterium]|nr:CapA family protein [Clostridia bacterium]NCC43278.1 CapA family protein [Clostridia bacterium]
MSYRRKIVVFQIGAITLAIFLLLMIGAVVLTKIFASGSSGTKQANAQVTADASTGDGQNTDGDAAGAENAGTQPSTPGEESAEGTDGEQVTSMSPVEAVKLTISAAGDCTLGTDVSFDTSSNFDAFYIVKKDYGYFLQNVKDIFSADDLTIVNMEGTLTESDERQDKTYAFKGDPKYTQVLTSGSVEAANLANNHSKDYGEQSYTDTIQHLEEAGVTTFGFDRTAVVESKGIKIGLVGIYVLADGLERQQQLIDNIASVKAQGAQVVIVSFHWGTEKSNYPDDIQKTLAHAAIDNGADLVLGHHPHVLQGIEKYNGKNIVYSLGNFCFGGNRNPDDKDTMIFQQTFSFENGTLVQDDVTNIIPCSLSSVQQYNDYQPTPLEGAESERVMQKIQEFSNGLSNG